MPAADPARSPATHRSRRTLAPVERATALVSLPHTAPREDNSAPAAARPGFVLAAVALRGLRERIGAGPRAPRTVRNAPGRFLKFRSRQRSSVYESVHSPREWHRVAQLPTLHAPGPPARF